MFCAQQFTILSLEFRDSGASRLSPYLAFKHVDQYFLFRLIKYELPMAYARRPVAGALKQVQAALAQEGLGIKIFDAYRPYRATVKFYEVYRDTTYVASPYRGSRHNLGAGWI